MAFSLSIAVTVCENELHHVVTILIFTETKEFKVSEHEDPLIKFHLFLMIITQSQTILDKSSDYLVDAAII